MAPDFERSATGRQPRVPRPRVEVSGTVPGVAEVERVVSEDGTPIGFRVSGAGEPLVLVHGVGTLGADWLFALPFLRERFAVMTMDRQGRGSSGDAAAYSIDREAEDVLAVLEAVGGDLLVGHSYGALCSILAASRTDRLRRLVLYEPPLAIKTDWIGELDRLVVGGDHDAALSGFLRGADILEEQLEAIRSTRAWSVLLQAVPALPRELRAGAAWRLPEGPIRVPTLFLRGGDTVNPTYLEGFDRLAVIFTAARLQLIPGQRHIAHVFAPEEFAQAVSDFCAEPPV